MVLWGAMESVTRSCKEDRALVQLLCEQMMKIIRSLTLITRYPAIQFSVRNPDTRSNSRVLFVTTINPRERA